TEGNIVYFYRIDEKQNFIKSETHTCPITCSKDKLAKIINETEQIQRGEYSLMSRVADIHDVATVIPAISKWDKNAKKDVIPQYIFSQIR
ncbi:unnamed protein product, partial [Amoebophrya sp. A25]